MFNLERWKLLSYIMMMFPIMIDEIWWNLVLMNQWPSGLRIHWFIMFPIGGIPSHFSRYDRLLLKSGLPLAIQAGKKNRNFPLPMLDNGIPDCRILRRPRSITSIGERNIYQPFGQRLVSLGLWALYDLSSDTRNHFKICHQTHGYCMGKLWSKYVKILWFPRLGISTHIYMFWSVWLCVEKFGIRCLNQPRDAKSVCFLHFDVYRHCFLEV